MQPRERGLAATHIRIAGLKLKRSSCFRTQPFMVGGATQPLAGLRLKQSPRVTAHGMVIQSPGRAYRLRFWGNG